MKEKIKDSVPDFLSASFYLIIILPKVLTANEQICIVYLFTLPKSRVRGMKLTLHTLPNDS